jgi:cysteine sulfinate desulfinase/cysteine desulfurase-like protein
VIYLDHNATTPVLPEVFEAMRPYFCEEWGNPSSTYKFGSKLKAVIETARAQVAELTGAHSRDVMFASCATESNNAASHAALMVEIDVSRDGGTQADYLSLTGHKFHAPKGVGALYVRGKAPFSPLIHGGHQERNLRG